MATTATARFDLKISAPLSQDNPAAASPGDIDSLVKFSSSEITKRHYKVYNIAASGSQSLDLVSALTDAYGTALTFAKVKALVVRNKSTSTTAAATVERPSSNGVPILSAAGTIAVDPIFVYVNKAGATVTASTGDLISINNADSAASADIEVLILGI